MWDEAEAYENSDANALHSSNLYSAPHSPDDLQASDWVTIYGDKLLYPQTEPGKRKVVDLLKSPPPLQLLKTAIPDIPLFHGVPQTAPARRHPADVRLFLQQKKSWNNLCTAL